jgi:hypothetical protein
MLNDLSSGIVVKNGASFRVITTTGNVAYEAV